MRVLLLSLAVLVYAGCDSNDGPFEGGQASCSSVGATASGLFTGTTPSGSFSPNCLTLRFIDGGLYIQAQEVRFSGGTVDFEEGILLLVGSDDPGTYAIGFDDETSGFPSATYSTGLVTGADADADAGTITITDTDGGASGSFAFSTPAGQNVSGRFDLSL